MKNLQTHENNVIYAALNLQEGRRDLYQTARSWIRLGDSQQGTWFEVSAVQYNTPSNLMCYHEFSRYLQLCLLSPSRVTLQNGNFDTTLITG